MDFKQYVKMILEADKKAEDKNKKSEKFDDEEDNEEDEEFDDEEDEASCKTHKNGCTGCEASVEDKDDLNENHNYYYGSSLKEEMINSSNYIRGENYNTITEEKEISMVLTESIKNNSASKFLEKQSKKALKEAEKLSSKGKKEEAKLAKEAGKSLKEASAKLYKVESDYKAGDPTAKATYKKLCKEYSKVLKQKGKALKGVGRFTAALAGTVAGAALLGTVGLTALANDDIIERLEDGIRNDKLGEVIKGMAIKDKEALKDLVDAAKEGIGKDVKNSNWKSGIFDNTKESIKKAAEDIDRNAYKNDGYHDGREKLADNAGKMAKVFGIKNKDGEAFNYKDMFGKKK